MINNKIEVSDQDRKLVMSIERDRIWVDPTVGVDETAQAVLDALRQYIINMIDAAVKEEREACAKVAERSHLDNMVGEVWTSRAAAAIRARGQG